jgi:DinB superfamily
MDMLEYLRTSVKAVNEMVDNAMQDLTDDVVNFQPGGTANTIAQLLAHVISGQDLLINDKIGGGRSLHETGWAEKTGIPLERPLIWQRAGWELDLPGFDAYRTEVARSAESTFMSMKPADLDREVSWVRGPDRPLAMMTQAIFVNHGLGHCGEISAIKGIQGLKGLPI